MKDNILLAFRDSTIYINFKHEEYSEIVIKKVQRNGSDKLAPPQIMFRGCMIICRK